MFVRFVINLGYTLFWQVITKEDVDWRDRKSTFDALLIIRDDHYIARPHFPPYVHRYDREYMPREDIEMTVWDVPCGKFKIPSLFELCSLVLVAAGVRLDTASLITGKDVKYRLPNDHKNANIGFEWSVHMDQERQFDNLGHRLKTPSLFMSKFVLCTKAHALRRRVFDSDQSTTTYEFFSNWDAIFALNDEQFLAYRENITNPSQYWLSFDSEVGSYINVHRFVRPHTYNKPNPGVARVELNLTLNHPLGFATLVDLRYNEVEQLDDNINTFYTAWGFIYDILVEEWIKKMGNQMGYDAKYRLRDLKNGDLTQVGELIYCIYKKLGAFFVAGKLYTLLTAYTWSEWEYHYLLDHDYIRVFFANGRRGLADDVYTQVSVLQGLQAVKRIDTYMLTDHGSIQEGSPYDHFDDREMDRFRANDDFHYDSDYDDPRYWGVSSDSDNGE